MKLLIQIDITFISVIVHSYLNASLSMRLSSFIFFLLGSSFEDKNVYFS